MTKFLKSKADFTWERVASTFKVKDALLAQFATWMENELWIKHKFDDIESTSPSIPIAETNEVLQDSTHDAVAIGLGLHPFDLQRSNQRNDEVALQERFEIEIQRMCSEHSIATTEEFISLLNLYLVQRF